MILSVQIESTREDEREEMIILTAENLFISMYV